MPRATKKAEQAKRSERAAAARAAKAAKGAAKSAGKATGGKSKWTAKARRKTSVYLDPAQRRHLERIAKRTGRPQAELIREAITSYEPAGGTDRNFALAGGFDRIDSDPRPISAIPEEELMRGFGE